MENAKDFTVILEGKDLEDNLISFLTKDDAIDMLSTACEELIKVIEKNKITSYEHVVGLAKEILSDTDHLRGKYYKL